MADSRSGRGGVSAGARIYMDYQGSAPTDPRVVEAMQPYWTDVCGNPHASDHAFGWDADRAVEAARGRVAALMGADDDELIFTSGATEANNLAILGIARASSRDRDRIVVSAIEHTCVLAAAQAAQGEGFEVVRVPPGRDGLIDPAAVAAMVNDRTALVSVMAVNNEIGTVQPLREIAATCEDVGAVFHTDAAQALCFMPMLAAESGADLISLSAHKAYGPKGVGALYVRRSSPVRPLPILHGGGQEQGLRSGTLPTPLCVGFGEACRILACERDSEVPRIAALRDRLLLGLQQTVPRLAINGTMTPRHPGNLNVWFPAIEADLLLQRIQPLVAASTGSACTSGQPAPSHVLHAIGLPRLAAESSIRFSIGRFTTMQDVDAGLEILRQALEQIELRADV